MNENIKQYVEIKKKIRELENALSFLEPLVKEELEDKIEIGGFVLSKKSRDSYSLKKDADLKAIKEKYPKICTVTSGIDSTKIDIEIVKQQFPDAYYENISVDAKLLYTIAEDPKSVVDEKTTTYLETREVKEKKAEDLDF